MEQTQNAKKNKYGQYFTPKSIANFMLSRASVPKSAQVLEPSAGDGVFLEVLKENGFHTITGYEVDPMLGRTHPEIKHESFVSAKLSADFDLVIGNPPYIRWKNLEEELKKELQQNRLWNTYFNSLCDYSNFFILKSVEILKEGGELIFICPEYWFSTTHAKALRNYLLTKGYFEEIFYFNEAPIFKGATVSLIIFKFKKTKNKNKTATQLVSYGKNKKITEELLSAMGCPEKKHADLKKVEIPAFKKNKPWILASKEELNFLENLEVACLDKKEHLGLFEASKKKLTKLADVCTIANGMVSGLDKAFQIKNIDTLTEKEKKYLLKVIKAKHLSPFTAKGSQYYLWLNDAEIPSETEFSTEFPHFYEQLLPFREKLQQRYQYGREIPYWEWAFPRSYSLFSNNKPRIFVPCKERISNKDYFRFSLTTQGNYPTQDVTALFKKEEAKESIYYILAFLNTEYVFHWLKFKGIVKGSIVEFSERPLASLPFREINWADEKEKKYHDEITVLTKQYLSTKSPELLKKIQNLFFKLITQK